MNNQINRHLPNTMCCCYRFPMNEYLIGHDGKLNCLRLHPNISNQEETSQNNISKRIAEKLKEGRCKVHIM